jgi:hypothetical protein
MVCALSDLDLSKMASSNLNPNACLFVINSDEIWFRRNFEIGFFHMTWVTLNFLDSSPHPLLGLQEEDQNPVWKNVPL